MIFDYFVFFVIVFVGLLGICVECVWCFFFFILYIDILECFVLYYLYFFVYLNKDKWKINKCIFVGFVGKFFDKIVFMDILILFIKREKKNLGVIFGVDYDYCFRC